ncbi:hypothetical protein CEXT_529211 [Caerostris extrusa]|uniref:Uncharacterized protein n=1 Tax=Caerostris extrusa TaxID=172846 RepID=A0AAV4VR02_CAEEX|nr:hypothetical protein CEXT_529211 [Caerostris extrusa]
MESGLVVAVTSHTSGWVSPYLPKMFVDRSGVGWVLRRLRPEHKIASGPEQEQRAPKGRIIWGRGPRGQQIARQRERGSAASDAIVPPGWTRELIAKSGNLSLSKSPIGGIFRNISDTVTCSTGMRRKVQDSCRPGGRSGGTGKTSLKHLQGRGGSDRQTDRQPFAITLMVPLAIVFSGSLLTRHNEIPEVVVGNAK